MTISKIISGGQTGVDRAALDAAISAGIPHGGWMPAGRWAEDGIISTKYMLIETPSHEPAQRTEWNVRDSDATLVLGSNAASPGTALTIEMARKYRKPILVIYLEEFCCIDDVATKINAWIKCINCSVLNIAGPRASEWNCGYANVLRTINAIISQGEVG